MGFLEDKELNSLKNEIKAKNIAVEADKYSYELQLLNGLGEEIKNTLNNPPKPSLMTKLKIKIARWKKIIQEKNKWRLY